MSTMMQEVSQIYLKNTYLHYDFIWVSFILSEKTFTYFNIIREFKITKKATVVFALS
jgi:hypothetical protein